MEIFFKKKKPPKWKYSDHVVSLYVHVGPVIVWANLSWA